MATQDAASEGHARLVEALRDPHCYPHPVARVEVIETHISTVLLAGGYAYKLRKPVHLAFLDFSTLARRRQDCEDELRLNRRWAPQLYLDVVAIGGDAARPRILGAGDAGSALEYALRMRAFDQDGLFDRLARARQLVAGDIDALAAHIHAVHCAAPVAAAGSQHGNPAVFAGWMQRNLDELAGLAPAALAPALAALAAWSGHAMAGGAALAAARVRQGRVRECHGDLHLGNIVRVDGSPLAFDCLEFNPELRWIDVLNDLSFAWMDLHYHGLPELAWRLLDAWLERSGDFGGLALLPLYAVSRALVRAKVALLRAGGLPPGAPRERELESATRHVELATQLAAPRRRLLAVTSGLAGSGKSSVSAHLLERLGAIRLRSDVERKRLAGLRADERATAAPGAGLYGATGSRRTYRRLVVLAGRALDAGYPVLVDAAFLRRADRRTMATLAHRRDLPFAIVECTAPGPILRERLARRATQACDASDAGPAVLDLQLSLREPFDAAERAWTLAIDTAVGEPAFSARCDELTDALAAAGAGRHPRGSR